MAPRSLTPRLNDEPTAESTGQRALIVNVWTPRFPYHDLSYRWASSLGVEARIGLRVVVPLRKQQVTGYITEVNPKVSLPENRLRSVSFVLDTRPLLPDELLRCLQWASHYYLYPLGAYIHAALPPGLHSMHHTLVRLTPEGRHILAQMTAQPRRKPPAWLRILEYLNQVREAPVTRIRRVLKIRNPGPAIQYLKARGFVRLREKTHRGTRLPRVKVIHFVRHPQSGERLSAAQKKLLDTIADFRRDILLEELADCTEATPDRLRRLQKRGFIQIYEQYRPRPLHWSSDSSALVNIQLNADQQRIIDAVIQNLQQHRFHPAVLYGVTGSGKTEVYLAIAEYTVNQGKSVIVLMPEIGLIPSVIDRFQRRFGEQLAILHSALPNSERTEMWWRIAHGDASVVLGTRSAVFAPFQNLGLIVVDEEQDGSYKQYDTPVYHARDVALVRARLASCPVLLVSATPSVETFARTENGSFHLYTLKKRAVPGAVLPDVSIVDMRKELKASGDPFFSQTLIDALQDTLNQKETAIVLINRKGYAVSVFCRGCGYTFECHHCSIHLFYHREPPVLRCHYCGYERPIPKQCPACGESRLLSTRGLGTERAVKLLSEWFPGAAIARLDQDLVAHPVRLFDTLARFQRGEIQILVGTQMVAKGHHFPRVTLAAVLEADGAAGIPDFRSAERLFQIITQVIGRSGRTERPGRAIIQTYRPDYYAIRYACAHDFHGFYREELKNRFRYRFPPFTSLIAITIRDRDRSRAHALATNLTEFLRQDSPPLTTIDGPITPILWRLRGWYRFHILIRTRERTACRNHIQTVLNRLQPDRSQIHIDVDPDQIV